MEKLKELIKKYGFLGTVVIVLSTLLVAFITTSCSHFHLRASDLELKSNANYNNEKFIEKTEVKENE